MENQTWLAGATHSIGAADASVLGCHGRAGTIRTTGPECWNEEGAMEVFGAGIAAVWAT
jgi:hypothetical protein